MITLLEQKYGEGIDYSLSHIVADSMPPIFVHPHLNKDWIIGLIGDRGSGKSTSSVFLAMREFVFGGMGLYSNMGVKVGFSVPDSVSVPMIGKTGGQVFIKAGHINKQQFLSLDGRYDGSCLLFDEFNIEYGESRKSMTNVNLAVDNSMQQLRKMQCGMIYTCINEAYVDVRIRENTDLFISCKDVAYKPKNMLNRMPPGVTFSWKAFPMSDRVLGIGRTYSNTGKALGPYNITLKDWWGSFDTYQKQAVGNRKYSQINMTSGESMGQDMRVDIQEDVDTILYRKQWGWLDESLDKFLKRHKKDGSVIEITSQDFAQELNVAPDKWGSVVAQIYRRLPDMSDNGREGFRRRKYIIPNMVTSSVAELIDSDD